MILLIDNYDSFTFNIVHLLGSLGVEAHVVRNDKITLKDIHTISPRAIILSPGPCTPNEAGICLNLIQEFSGNIPIFGICLGMQSMGQIFGGEVRRAQSLFHGKTSKIIHHGHKMFQNIPSPFTAARYHSLIVDKNSLPDCLEVTATVENGEIMALAHKTHPTFGVQFHPESIASEYGATLMQNFLHNTE